MTRKEAIKVIKVLFDNPLFSDLHRAAFNIAMHDIKAHHDWDINNLILINKDNYEPLEQEPILDKIFSIVHPLSIMSTPELEHNAIMQIAEMLGQLCLPESEDKE